LLGDLLPAKLKGARKEGIFTSLDIVVSPRFSAPSAKLIDTIGADDALTSGYLASKNRGETLFNAVNAGKKCRWLAYGYKIRCLDGWIE
jgi:sugar/nucleoside kinase (ribokinase family)